MKGLDLIKEDISPVEDKPWLRNFFPPNVIQDALEGGCYAYCIYVETHGQTKLIRGKLMYDCEREGRSYRFVEHLKKYDPQSFKEMLFYLDLYPLGLPDVIDRSYGTESAMTEVIEAILEDTRGVLLWNHQVENIINIFVLDRNEVLLMRKGVNAKKAEALDRLRHFRIDEATTLLDFINSRMIRGHTRYPNIPGAYVLYELSTKDER